MTMARSVRQHLNKVGVQYEILNHPHSSTSRQSAQRAHLPASQVAKAVMTRDGDKYLLCVIPSGNRLVFSWLNSCMNGDYRLCEEAELQHLFDDCEFGAVPALGQVYGFPVIWDEKLGQLKDVYIESGDHENLIHLDQGAFQELMGLQEHMTISCPDYEYGDFMSH